MSVTVALALTAIRSSTLHDSDTQTTDLQITAELDQAYLRMRRRLAGVCPQLYLSVTTPTIAAGANTIAVPANTERIWKLERLISGTDYYELDVWDDSDPFGCALGFFEQAATYVVRPDEDAPGDYRLTVVGLPATIIGLATSTVLNVPIGCEAIIYEEVAAWVRQRHDEDPGYHERKAAMLWKEQSSALRRRYGVHVEPGIKHTSRGTW